MKYNMILASMNVRLAQLACADRGPMTRRLTRPCPKYTDERHSDGTYLLKAGVVCGTLIGTETYGPEKTHRGDTDGILFTD
jgi:hypothetical protein